MPLISLNLRQPLPVYWCRLLARVPFSLNSTEVSRGHWPGRGLMYSFLVHETMILSLLLLPSFGNVRKPVRAADQLIAIDLNGPAKLIYFPDLNGNDENQGARRKGSEVLLRDEPVGEQVRSAKGLSYPGPQAIISEPPKADNRFQTLLQPALQDPPVLQPPAPLPNMIQSAYAGPLPQAPSPSLVPQAEPKPAEPVLPPTPLQRSLRIAPPSPTTAQKSQAVLPVSPLTPDAPGEKPIELTMMQKGLAISSPPAVVAPRPKVVLPLATSAPVVAAPEKPIELTALHKDLIAPPPSQVVVPNPRIALTAPTAPSLPAPALPAPERPPEPASAAKEPAVPPPAPAPEQPKPQVATVPTQGPDPQNLLSVTPLPAPPQPSVRVPTAVARGRVAISPESNLNSSAAQPGVKADNLPTTAAAADRKADDAQAKPPGPDKNGGKTAGAASADGGAKPPAPSNSPGSPNGIANAKDGGKSEAGVNTGRGNGASGASEAGDTPAKTPFAGITIQGGRLESGTGVISGSAPPRTGTATPPPSAAPKIPYSITIVSTTTSGGGLPDLGVFSREHVYTVYIDMKDKTGAAAPWWTMQYALAQATPNPAGWVPPFPLVKETPDFPVELLRKYTRRLVIVYGIIDAAGQLQQMAVKQSPDGLLNPAALAALSKWLFRPAEINGSPAPVKILMGIPLALPQASNSNPPISR